MPPSTGLKPKPSYLNFLDLKSVLTFLSCCTAIYSTVAYNRSKQVAWPQQAIYINPNSFAALSPSGSVFRDDGFSEFFNPTSTQPPFFQVFDTSFLSVLGSNASIYEISSNENFAFAHEAPIYDPETDQVFFASNAGGTLGFSDLDNNNQVAKFSMREVESELADAPLGTAVNVSVTRLDLPDIVQMTNGGTGPYNSNLLFINEGRGPRPPTITLVSRFPPYNATVLLDNYYGRQFNSLNDIKIHPSGNIFFTDSVYGYVQDFRPPPLMPNQVYRFNPRTGAVRAVAGGFDKPNGIAFSPDGRTAYISDTGALSGPIRPIDPTAPATIYAFDIDSRTQAFTNRRMFAYVDTGIPDGIQVDLDGNIYSGCGDGVHVWNGEGTLLGKFYTGGLTPNMVFAGNGRLVILSEFKIFVAYIVAKHVPLTFPR